MCARGAVVANGYMIWSYRMKLMDWCTVHSATSHSLRFLSMSLSMLLLYRPDTGNLFHPSPNHWLNLLTDMRTYMNTYAGLCAHIHANKLQSEYIAKGKNEVEAYRWQHVHEEVTVYVEVIHLSNHLSDLPLVHQPEGSCSQRQRKRRRAKHKQ